MASDRSFRQRLRATVLEANTPAGKIYNLVIFGAILLSVVVLLLEPNPLGNSALQQTEVLWIDLVQDSCLAVFAADFVLHLAVVPSPAQVPVQLHRPDRSQCGVVLLCAAGSQRIAALGVQVWPHFAGVQAAQVHR
jgi:hypothetical protein